MGGWWKRKRRRRTKECLQGGCKLHHWSLFRSTGHTVACRLVTIPLDRIDHDARNQGKGRERVAAAAVSVVPLIAIDKWSEVPVLVVPLGQVRHFWDDAFPEINWSPVFMALIKAGEYLWPHQGRNQVERLQITDKGDKSLPLLIAEWKRVGGLMIKEVGKELPFDDHFD